MADHIAIIRRPASKIPSSQAATSSIPISYCQNSKEKMTFGEEPSQLNKHVQNGLSLESAVKQLNDLLLCERLETVEVKRPPYSKEELAQLFGISVNEINKILRHQTAGRFIVSKITLPLAKLYCSVKFSDQSQGRNR